MTTIDDVTEGQELEPLQRTPDALDLFLYSASVWLPHRIHYDVAHTTGHEGHPGLLVQGPLQGVYLMQVLTHAFGSGIDVRTLKFRHQIPVYVDQTLHCRGRVTRVDRETGELHCELWTELDDGRQATVAESVLVLSDRA